jgi:hypothetical protein
VSPRILLWDIENTPLLGYAWGTYNTNIIHVLEPQRVMSFAAKWSGAPKSSVEYRSTFHDGRTEMLLRAAELLNEADAVVSYNGARHDTPHIFTEFLREGVDIPSPYREIDLWKVTRGKLKLPNNKLNTVLHEFNLGSKVEHEGFGLWLKCMAGDEKAWARFRRYNIGDVLEMEKAYQLYRPIIPQSMHPNFGLYCDGEVCPRCGAKKPQRRGKREVGVSLYPRFWCRSCKTWSRGKYAVDRVELRGI